MGELFLMVSMATEVLLTDFFPPLLLSRVVAADSHFISQRRGRVPAVGQGGPHRGAGLGALGLLPSAAGPPDTAPQPVAPLRPVPCPSLRRRTASPARAVQLPTCSPKPPCAQGSGAGPASPPPPRARPAGPLAEGAGRRAAGRAADGVAAVGPTDASASGRQPGPGRGAGRHAGASTSRAGRGLPGASHFLPTARAWTRRSQDAGLCLRVAALPAPRACSPWAEGPRPAGTRAWGVTPVVLPSGGTRCLLASCRFLCCPTCGSVGPKGQAALGGVAPSHRTWGSCLWDAAGVEGPSPRPAPPLLARTLARSLRGHRPVLTGRGDALRDTWTQGRDVFWSPSPF